MLLQICPAKDDSATGQTLGSVIEIYHEKLFSSDCGTNSTKVL